MGNCCSSCLGLFRKQTNRIQRGGGSKYFRTSSGGEHYTIEFENLVESDEGESPGSNQRPLSEEEISALKERRYDSIAENQKLADAKLQTEQRLQRIKQRTFASGKGEFINSSGTEDFESYIQAVKSQSEAFRSSRISSESAVLTPNTESSCDLTTKTKSASGNEDSTSLDLEWEDEEGMSRMVPLRERSKTEEDILQAALRPSNKSRGSNAASASEDSNGLEWENDFVGAEVDDNGNSEYAGFVNPVLEMSTPDLKSDSDQQDR
ncbi:AP-1 complex-associated regulatory protein isoform X4 [Protopterus annectens]|uniref:AP-1 complex-associated regulatory protein isoform X4 n=1 Tax=Protopterus annectens TaxID=7888 RepID=UPI001CFB83A1|nr:AP-1 complex-associated regulatory protein isoform X4 [Protopterus annectens]